MATRKALFLLSCAMLSSTALGRELRHDPLQWPHDYASQPADPAVRFGRLANGVKYAILHNQNPQTGLSMRFRIGAGSLQEHDGQEGYAHFLEHMAFRGSSHVKDGDVVKILERQGLQFGADTNAITTHDETIYMFDFPLAGDESLTTGVRLFREIAERLDLDGGKIELEKGVILSEERLRDTPMFRSMKANFGASLAGTRAVTRWPIGHVDSIKAASAETLREYYSRNYVPSNATLVVVGNMDIEQVEAKIQLMFGDWVGPQFENVALGSPSSDVDVAELSEGGLPHQLTLTWPHPLDPGPDTREAQRQQLTELLGLTALNIRLADLSARPNAPYLSASAQFAKNLMGVADAGVIGINPKEDRWSEALTFVLTAKSSLEENGPSTSELTRAISLLKTDIERLAASAAGRRSATIADEIVSSLNDRHVFTSPAQDLEFVNRELPSLGVSAAREGLSRVFGRGRPILFRSSPTGAVGLGRLSAALNDSLSRRVDLASDTPPIAWPYSETRPAARVIERHYDAELDATFVTFESGARLALKKTHTSADRIDIRSTFGHGYAGVEPKLRANRWAASMTAAGGLGKMSYQEIQQWAQESRKTIGVSFDLTATALNLNGTSSVRDLESELRLMQAFATDPGYGPLMGDQLERAKQAAPGQIDANPAAVLTRSQQQLLSGGDRRFVAIPDAVEIKAAKIEDIRAMVGNALASPRYTVIVGDIDSDSAISAFARTLGTIAAPSTKRQGPAINAPLAPATIKERHSGREDQGEIALLWRLPDYWASPQTAYAAEIAAAVINGKLIDGVREALGMTYSPRTESMSSTAIGGLGYLTATIETPPQNFESFQRVVRETVEALATHAISDDELVRAKGPLLERQRLSAETNGYWIGALERIEDDPRNRSLVLNRTAAIEAVTATEVRNFAKAYLDGRTPSIIEVMADPSLRPPAGHGG